MNMSLLIGYRRLTGLTQENMAKIIGISLSSYKMKEKGLSEFKHSEMIKFYKVVQSVNPNISFEDIFFDKNVHECSFDVKDWITS